MELSEIVNGIYSVSPKAVDKLSEIAVDVEYPKGFRLMRQGQRTMKAYFISNGLVRTYANVQDKDVTFWFGSDGDVIIPLNVILYERAEYGTVELLERSTFYEFDVLGLRHLYQSDIELANWGRTFAEQSCARAEQLFIDRQFKTSYERYGELIAKHPDILQRVPLGIIASYIGTTQANLSRIRASIK